MQPLAVFATLESPHAGKVRRPGDGSLQPLLEDLLARVLGQLDLFGAGVRDRQRCVHVLSAVMRRHLECSRAVLVSETTSAAKSTNRVGSYIEGLAALVFELVAGGEARGAGGKLVDG